VLLLSQYQSPNHQLVRDVPAEAARKRGARRAHLTPYARLGKAAGASAS